MIKGLFISLLIISLGAVAFVSYFVVNSRPVDPNNTATKTFVVNKGDGVKSIALRLKQNGYINDRYVFIAHALLLGLDHSLQAGAFTLSPSFSTSQIITKLSQGGRFDIRIKIVDGQRNEEIAKTLAQNDLFDKKSFIASAVSKQGMLYPDTYNIPAGCSLTQFFDIVNANFIKKIANIKADETDTALNDEQIITLASIIEREARTEQSKQYVAGILLNRLAINMPLQIDATVQYARDSRLPQPQQFWQPLAKKDLSLNSPYNTYLNAGLPPTPICNPGYDAIYAAYHPIVSDYLFYITGNDNQMHYAKTLTEHNANIAKYLK